MRRVELTAFDFAQRFIGTAEVPGVMSNPLVLAMLKLDAKWAEDDAVPWCSSFVNWICWALRLPRSKSAAARSWLSVGRAVHLAEAEVGFDVVVFNRGGSPDPDVLSGPGHVGFFAGRDGNAILVLGGNQSDCVKVSRYHTGDLLGIRRIYE